MKRLILSAPNLNHGARWLPGGKDLVYVHTESGHSALYRSSLADPSPRALLGEATASCEDPAPSPDGRFVAFCRNLNENWDLWISGPDGADARAVHAGRGLDTEPAWSADGGWILFATWQEGHFRIARVRPDGSGFELLTGPGFDGRCPVHVETAGKK